MSYNTQSTQVTFIADSNSIKLIKVICSTFRAISMKSYDDKV